MPRDAEGWLAQQGVTRSSPVAASPREARDVELDPDVAAALTFVRRSVAGTPQSERRVHAKLVARGVSAEVADAAMAQARLAGLVDDAAMAAALVDEWRRKGHAPSRIGRDLRARGFGGETVDAALRATQRDDPEAAAFAAAHARASRLTGLPAETAYRRVAAHVLRLGYTDALARKVARQAVFASREPEHSAGR